MAQGIVNREYREERTMNSRVVADLVRKWGHPTSVALLDATCSIFTTHGAEGIIGYRGAGSCLVVFGDPVCAPHQRESLVKAFHEFAARHKKSVIYAATSGLFADWALRHGCQAALGIGHELILNPQDDPKLRKGADASSLRNKWHHSIRQAVIVKEYTGYDTGIEQAINGACARWLQARKGPQICLLSQLNFFADRSNTRLFYAEQQGTIVGILWVSRIDAYHGWFINICIALPEGPNTTSEFMIMTVLDLLRAEGCEHFSVGTTPAPELGRVEGLGPLSTWLARKAFGIAHRVFNLQHRQRYWKKFKPLVEPSYLVFAKKRIGVRDILGIVRAFNG